MILIFFFVSGGLKKKWGRITRGNSERRKSVLDSIETIVFLYRYHP